MTNALSELHHLGALGLPDTVTMPSALRLLHSLVASDTNHFTWVDANLREANYYGEGGVDEAAVAAFFQHAEQLQGPGSPSFRFAVRHLESIHWLSSDRDYASSTIYQMVMRPLGGEQVFCFNLWDARGRSRGMVSMMRDSVTAPFTVEEKRRALLAGRAMAALFDNHDEIGDGLREGGYRAIAQATVILDAEGRLTHCDAKGRHLLRLACYPLTGQRYRLDVETAGISRQIKELCRSLLALQKPQATAPPCQKWTTPWGIFHFRPTLLMPAGERGEPSLIAVAITHLVPRALALWQTVQGLPLSDRQRRVCLSFVLGRSLTEIADELRLSRHTVIDHLNKVYEKLNLEPGRDVLQEHLHALGMERAQDALSFLS